MYALKARDKLHKREKESYEERLSPRNRRSRDSGAVGDKTPAKTVSREAKYVGSFSMDMAGGWKSTDFEKVVKQQLSRVNTKDRSTALMLVSLLINMEGIKVLSADGKTVVMAHALKRILYCTSDSKKHLFAIVARNPQEGTEGVYTHVFVTDKKDQVNELNHLVSKAFKVHFTSKTIARQKKEVVKKSPRNSRASPQPQRSPSPQPPSPQPSATPVPPYNPAVLPEGDQSQPSSWRNSQPVTVHERKNRIQLLQESGVVELEIATIETRLRDIEGQMRELAGFEDAIVQLTMQTSRLQQQLDEKKRLLSALQFQIQDLTLHDQNHLQPIIPERHVDPLPDFRNISLEDADWFQEGIPREITMEILSLQPVGAFMVRQSSSNVGSYALSMKAPNNKILHYLITNVPGGLQLQGSSTIYPSVVELVYNYTVNKDNLPCTLNLSTSNPAFLEGDGTHGSDSDDEDYLGVAQYRLIS